MAHPDNPNAHLTAKEREGASFPTKHLLRLGLIRGRVLDFGSGFGADTRFLEGRGFDVTAHDPYHAPALPEGQFDTVLCQYVLNVLLPEEEPDALMSVSELVAPGGTAYFAVRRDVGRGGYRRHSVHGVSTFQRTVALPYESVLRNDFCEVYAYRPLSALGGVKGCPFCRSDARRTLLTESADAYAILDGYPVSRGHALVIPKRHVSDYFELSAEDQAACWSVVNRARAILAKRFGAADFNVGINAGRAAGQTVMHAHVHLIPRYEGDVPNPRGGVRHVIPGRGDYRSARG